MFFQLHELFGQICRTIARRDYCCQVPRPHRLWATLNSHTQRAREVKRPDREAAIPTSVCLRDYECEIFYLHFTMHLHDILRTHRGLCWELLRKSRAKSSQHGRFSIAVLLNNLKSHQTG